MGIGVEQAFDGEPPADEHQPLGRRERGRRKESARHIGELKMCSFPSAARETSSQYNG